MSWFREEFSHLVESRCRCGCLGPRRRRGVVGGTTGGSRASSRVSSHDLVCMRSLQPQINSFLLYSFLLSLVARAEPAGSQRTVANMYVCAPMQASMPMPQQGFVLSHGLPIDASHAWGTLWSSTKQAWGITYRDPHPGTDQIRAGTIRVFYSP